MLTVRSRSVTHICRREDSYHPHMLLDSRNLYGRGDVLRFDLAPPSAEAPGLLERTWIAIRTWLGRGDLPLYRELGPENGRGAPTWLQDRRCIPSAWICAVAAGRTVHAQRYESYAPSYTHDCA